MPAFFGDFYLETLPGFGQRDISAFCQTFCLAIEIAISEQYLGTFRDEHGNNRFTFHPEYRLEYSNNYTGIEEEAINALPLTARNNFVAKESAYYPHFFWRQLCHGRLSA